MGIHERNDSRRVPDGITFPRLAQDRKQYSLTTISSLYFIPWTRLNWSPSSIGQHLLTSTNSFSCSFCQQCPAPLRHAPDPLILVINLYQYQIAPHSTYNIDRSCLPFEYRLYSDLAWSSWQLRGQEVHWIEGMILQQAHSSISIFFGVHQMLFCWKLQASKNGCGSVFPNHLEEVPIANPGPAETWSLCPIFFCVWETIDSSFILSIENAGSQVIGDLQSYTAAWAQDFIISCCLFQTSCNLLQSYQQASNELHDLKTECYFTCTSTRINSNSALQYHSSVLGRGDYICLTIVKCLSSGVAAFCIQIHQIITMRLVWSLGQWWKWLRDSRKMPKKAGQQIMPRCNGSQCIAS